MAAAPQVSYRRAALIARVRSPRTRPDFVVEVFLLFEIACQLALAFTALGAARVVVRIAAFTASLLLLAILPPRGRSHPAGRWVVLVLLIVGLGIFHPSTNGWVPGIAQAALYLAIVAPLFWVPRSPIDSATLRRAILIIWTFESVSASVGVLQFYFPGRLEPNLSSVVAAVGNAYVRDLHFAAADGRWIIRPMGLTDVPGGAAVAGLYTVLLGTGLFLSERRVWMRLACAASMSVGMVCVYLCQVGSILAVLVISQLAFAVILMWRGQKVKSTIMAVLVAAVVLGSFYWAVAVGGDDALSRVEAFRQSPGDVYLKKRGRFLTETIQDLLPQYPLGAGLGRWGMTSHYFGDRANPDSSAIWVEIQWTGWLLDGGLPLIVAYVAAFAVTFQATLKIALSRDSGDLWLWGAMLCGYDTGVLANTFAYPVFIGQGGLEFWLLNALLWAAASQTVRYPNRFRLLRS